MPLNAGGINTVTYAKHPNGQPVSVGQLIQIGATNYIVTGINNAGTLFNVRSITTLAAASTVSSAAYTVLNDAATINAL